MPAISAYIPFYQGMTKVPTNYNLGTDHADNQSVNWRFRKLQKLVMTDWNQFSPVVKQAYKSFEQQTMINQQKLESEYLNTYIKDPKKAEALINQFEQQTTDNVLALTDRLTNDIFTSMTHKTDMEYHFAGA